MEGMLARRPAIRLLIAGRPGVGLAMAAQARPDLVLLDIQLPEMDGFEVLRRLQVLPATQGVPVVAVSANAMQADLDRAAVAGFADYVVKPLELPRLLTVVDRLLGQPRTA
jgi:CheY-like chemotaxis protein